MKLFFILFTFTFVGMPSAVAQLNDNNKIDVLIITDERKFNRAAFFTMFDSFEDVRWREMKHPEVLEFLGSDSAGRYDVVVFYDMPENVVLSADQKQRIQNFFSEGAPALFLHHALLSYREWDEFPEIIGGRYYNKTPLIRKNGDTVRSTYQHDVRYNVNIADKTHPIMRGMPNFEIFDEVYHNYYVKDDVKVLLTTEHPASGRILGWINKYGNSEIVYLLNGHSETAYNNPDYRKLILNAINWIASKNDSQH